ncbi:hypothetical protein [Shewanella indica]|uniref:hypothetical protein n=1 Tax=Shewanella indica TaxID=768528 RepID=UPI003003CDE7
MALKAQINGKACNPFSHDGYCIESVLFSDLNILKGFIRSNVMAFPDGVINEIVDNAIGDIGRRVRDIDDELNKAIEQRFRSQKNNRPEFANLDFLDVVRSWSDNGIFKSERVMSKPLIREFIDAVSADLGRPLVTVAVESDEAKASALFDMYVESIDTMDDLYPSFKSLFTQLGLLVDNAEGDEEAA